MNFTLYKDGTEIAKKKGGGRKKKEVIQEFSLID